MLRQNPTGGVRVLSNNHVLADENRGKRGDRILQPGTFDSGRSRDRIGELGRFVRLKATAPPGSTVRWQRSSPPSSWTT
jgi:hypothetical protein